jgi:hypothetical protein
MKSSGTNLCQRGEDRLSITHILRGELETEGDNRKARHAALDDGVTGRRISGSVEIATDACKLSLTGLYR